MTEDIKVFTTPSCPYCTKIKEWLDDNNYDYTEYDVAENREKAKEMIERTGQRGVPQTFVGDKEIIGFQPDKIEEAIEEAWGPHNRGYIMSDVTVEVFYSQTCPNCPPQKDLVNEFRDEKDVDVKMTDVAKNNGRAKEHGVRAVPTTVVDGPAIEQKTGFRGVMSENKLQTAIEVAKGEKDPDELETGLMDKIKGLLWTTENKMKVIKKGEGEAEIVVIGSLHGDEPAGKKAIEKLLQEKKYFNRPVKFIVANEKALAKDRRYLDVDANSSFPGDPNSDMHEERLAAKLTEEIREKTVIDLHTTMSTNEPFSTMKSTDEETIELVRDANVKRTVHFPEDSGVSIEVAGKGIIVETGPQGTKEAAKDSYKILKNFLKSKGVIDGDYERSEPRIFRYIDTVKGDWKFKAQNFKLVEKGKVYASRDGEELTADEDFYPVLMSTNGYEGKLGHKAEKIK